MEMGCLPLTSTTSLSARVKMSFNSNRVKAIDIFGEAIATAQLQCSEFGEAIAPLQPQNVDLKI